MNIRWSALSIEDREVIFDYLLNLDPAAAIRIDLEIEQQVENLARFPKLGRDGRVADTRELVINRTPYIVAYSLDADSLVVLRVIHSSQVWPANIDDL